MAAPARPRLDLVHPPPPGSEPLSSSPAFLSPRRVSAGGGSALAVARAFDTQTAVRAGAEPAAALAEHGASASQIRRAMEKQLAVARREPPAPGWAHYPARSGAPTEPSDPPAAPPAAQRQPSLSAPPAGDSADSDAGPVAASRGSAHYGAASAGAGGAATAAGAGDGGRLFTRGSMYKQGWAPHLSGHTARSRGRYAAAGGDPSRPASAAPTDGSHYGMPLRPLFGSFMLQPGQHMRPVGGGGGGSGGALHAPAFAGGTGGPPPTQPLDRKSVV